MGKIVPFAGLWIIGALLLRAAVLCAGQGILHDHNYTCDPETQYEHKGRCCSKCQPGEHMMSRCTSNTDTDCRICGLNEYTSHWNDDIRCQLHVRCDDGKGLEVLYHGNRTSPRECVCKEGYHLHTGYDICMENTECPPGFGVRFPVQKNQDTVCIACPVGYFSNSSSSKEKCEPWTNCTGLGLEEIVPGSNQSDAVCNRSFDVFQNFQVIICISLIVVSVLVTASAVFVCCKKMKSSKADLSKWMNEVCTRIQGAEQISPCIETKTNINSTDRKAANDRIHNPVEQRICIPISPDSIKVCGHLHGKSVPTEDEYTEKHNLMDSEEGSMNTASDSMADTEDTSLESDTSHCCSETSCQRLLLDRLQSIPHEELIFNPYFTQDLNGLIHANGLSRDGLEATTEPQESSCFYCFCQSMPGTYSSCPAHSTSDRNFGDDAGTSATETQCPQGTRSTPGGSHSSETPPPPSGKVTGNNNTTVISNGSVMNIKADVVLLVVSPSSQDAATVAESKEENIRNPVQEESQGECDSFVVNTQPHIGRYADFLPNLNTSSESWNTSPDHCTSIDSHDTLDKGQHNFGFSQNTTVLPIQEEGKPEFDVFEV
ncbi:tumor necrosis factor receptor superfamily member 11A [Spea bombifrons]|uniref:tumor necrosis factor receptor superfamily member 11A n=1 Tax=Spea bombifrons TaxID=233779 RepID=UPI00234A8AE1|nr:tumor necrosis factor receptor superfamily member 11A [Spea bombifrons]